MLLALLNITTIGTIAYHTYHEHRYAESAVIISSNQTPINGQFFSIELGFDDKQMEMYRAANRSFRPKANALLFELDSMKTLMFSELNNLSPNMVKIDSLTTEIGEHHAELKRQINTFYLMLKGICNEQQRPKLRDAFEPLFYQDGANEIKQHSKGNMQQGQHRGQGRGCHQQGQTQQQNQ